MRHESRTTSMSCSIFHIVTATTLSALFGACGLVNGLSGECETCPDEIPCTLTEECRALEFSIPCTTDRDCDSSEVCATVSEGTYCVEPLEDETICEAALNVTSVDGEEVAVCLDELAGVCNEGFCSY